MNNYKYLENINSPDDVKKLNNEQLNELCCELRDEIITTAAVNGGHVASNLGCVELTVALHKMFNSPEDQIVWDVGHQCYSHKLLTGRYKKFSTLRKKGGITGFTNPEESVHDVFYSGHSSTSISAAYGLAKAKKIKGEKGYVIAVIGDGSMTGGEAYEGLNNAYADSDNLIIVINDNQMSISKNGSSLAANLAKIRSTKGYYRSKMRFEKVLVHIPLIGQWLRRKLMKYKYALKGVLYHSTFFEDLGYAYLGPVDGHSLHRLEDIFEIAKLRGKATIVHVNTIKGKGYHPAEANPTLYHGVGSFDKFTGKVPPSKMNFSKSFSEAICSFAEKDKRICAVTAAMPSGTGLEEFSSRFADRYFDVGIAEQHAVTFSSGLAKNGMIPVFAVYSTFLQRAYDQIIHDVSLQKLKVIFAIDRAGFVGDDGQTHQGVFDIPMLISIPHIKIFAPASYEELNHMMYRAIYKENCPVAIRYPRGGEYKLSENVTAEDSDYSLYFKSDKKKKLVVTFGRIFANAYKAVETLNAAGEEISLLKLNTIKPISEKAVNYAKQFQEIHFYEESMRAGGIGEHFSALLEASGFDGEFKLTAVDEEFVEPASVDEQLAMFGLDINSMKRDIENSGENKA